MTKSNGIFSFFKNLISDPKKPDVSAASEEVRTSTPVTQAPAASSKRAQPEPAVGFVSDEIAHFSIQKLKEILDLSFGGNPVIADQAGDELSLEVVGAHDSSRLIGKDGMTLDALQTLMRAIIFKRFNTNIRVAINTEDYKRRREEQIRTQAEKGLQTVLTKNSRVSLRPMNAAERRLVHVIFENDNRVRTFSTGNGNYRHIVIEKRGPKSQNVDR
jgi:predicted RNA-binding protein Jag